MELTWRGFDDKKKELVITSAMRFISFDPEADFNRFDDFAMAAMTSVMVRFFTLSIHEITEQLIYGYVAEDSPD